MPDACDAGSDCVSDADSAAVTDGGSAVVHPDEVYLTPKHGFDGAVHTDPECDRLASATAVFTRDWKPEYADRVCSFCDGTFEPASPAEPLALYDRVCSMDPEELGLSPLRDGGDDGVE